MDEQGYACCCDIAKLDLEIRSLYTYSSYVQHIKQLHLMPRIRERGYERDICKVLCKVIEWLFQSIVTRYACLRPA
jgi:hypothetical protein